MSDEKLLKNSLKKLVNRWSKDDFLKSLDISSSKENMINVPLSEIIDNHYIKKAKISEVKIRSEARAFSEGDIYEPLYVRKNKDKYELIIGRVRYFAAKQIHLNEVPVIVLNLNNEEMLLALLAEIKDRKSTNFYELILVCNALKEEYGYKNKELSSFLDQSKSQISNLLRLLSLPEEALIDLSLGKLSYGHAKAISRLEKEEVTKIIERIYNEKLSVRQVEEIVRTIKGPAIIEKKEEVIIEQVVEEKPKEGVMIEGNSITLNFKDEKARDAAIKRIKKLIKRKKFVLI